MSDLILTRDNSMAKFLAFSLVAHGLFFGIPHSKLLKIGDNTLKLPSPPASRIQLKMKANKVTRAKKQTKRVSKAPIKKVVKTPIKNKLLINKASSPKDFNNILTKTQKFEKYIKSFQSPKYSRMAQRRGIQGTVVLGIILDEFGNVKKVNLKKSAGHGILDNSAIKAAKSWSFNKLPYSGVEVEKKIVFKLR